MNWRRWLALWLIAVWFGFTIGSVVSGYLDGVQFMTGLGLLAAAYLAISYGLGEARRLGSGPRVGDRVLRKGEHERLLRDWYAADRLTVEQFDLLMGEVVAGRAGWKDLDSAVRLAADLQYRAEVRAAARAGDPLTVEFSGPRRTNR